ncbi:sugar phosphate nucleotidyltransferase [Xanthomarina sp. F2636L]|uniref:sugar phosphate nucleotidyltransferase n=1 Tax=Xanthomarina sp. F2636L TaxID=2996018 RepID=UPI00225DF6AD|nr:sugar phosphate nucleotidyltransferase [Xanthomarina sp. F2636L]MCX7549710.1 sugar phosphate nucleotidyltransferase [Xanthomarina sp. F2636L]
MTQKSIAIMAAGMGSRFGGLKQTHTVVHEYAILDFSVYDAIQVGFNHLVFIVRNEILDVFEKRYSKKLPKHIQIDFVIQDTKDLPKRKKPWGTGHALLSLKNTINNPFALINADDFYGREAFELMHDALYQDSTQQNYFVGYQLKNTLSDFGTVSRGECILNEKQELISIIERTDISKDNVLMPLTTIVSMNFWGFTPEIFQVTAQLFKHFLLENKDSETAEFYIPQVVDYTIKENITTYKMLETNTNWFGVTYREDEPTVKKQLLDLISEDVYPTKLW